MAILKTLSRTSNSDQLVKYIFRYFFNDKKQVKNKPEEPPFILRHNIRSRSLKGFIREFNENEAFRLVHRKDSVKLFHTIISFSNKDKEHINDKLLKDIFKKFIAERGMNNLYTGCKHEDRDHIHLHISISGTQLNGRSSRISKQKLHHIKIALDAYQKEKYPQLINSLPEHGKGKTKSKEAILNQIMASRQTDKETLFKHIEATHDKSTSKEEFLSQLRERGFETYYRQGSMQGLKYNGKKYRFSGLGIDPGIFKAPCWLQMRETKELATLQSIRGNHPQKLRKSIPFAKEVNPRITLNDQELDELAQIRIKGLIAKERDTEDDFVRTLDVDDFGRSESTSDPINNNSMTEFQIFTNLLKPISIKK